MWLFILFFIANYSRKRSITVSQRRCCKVSQYNPCSSCLHVCTRAEGISFSWGSVHTASQEFESAALFLRLGLPSTQIRHEYGAFGKPRPSNRRNLKTLAFHFRVDGKQIFCKRSFSKIIASRWWCDFADRVFLKHESKMVGDCCVFKFLRRSVDGKHLMRFQSAASIFKFLQRSVDGARLEYAR